jgi:hypothetical protein
VVAVAHAGWSRRILVDRDLRLIALLAAVSAGATLAAPWLVSRPLLLIALSPRLPFLALAAANTPLLPFVVVGLLRTAAADPFHYSLGRRHGASLVERLPTSRFRVVSGVLARSTCLAIVIRPIGRHLVLAGAAGSSARAVAAADAVGTLAYLVLVARASDALL